jgi:amino acid adenylation domain-containing protein
MDDIADKLSTLSPQQRAALLERVGAQLMEQRAPVSTIPRRADDNPRVPLSLLQEQLWFLDQLVPGQSAYNIPSVFRLRGPLDLPALRRSLSDIVDRHDALRATFAAEDGVSYQLIAEPGAVAHHLVVEDLSDMTDHDERDAEALRRVTEEVRRPFDLSSGPLLRSFLVRLASDDHILAVTMHHIASDGWSTAVFTAELSQLYAAHHAGAAGELPELPVRYSDYAAWQRENLAGDAFDVHLDYWEKRLSALPTLEFPTDRPRPATLSYRSNAVSRVIPAELLVRLREMSASHGVTLFMTLMTAYQAVLARYSGQDEIVVGTTTTGREPRELEPLIGYFVNMVVLRTDVSGDPTFNQLLERVRGTVLEAWRHQQVPFERVVERLAPPRDPSRNPLFQVGLQLLGSATQGTEPTLPGLSAQTIDMTPGGHPFDLSVTVTESPDSLRLLAEYSIDLFDEPRMRRLLGHLERVLDAVAREPQTRLSQLPLLSDVEREQLLVGWQGPLGERSREPVHAQIAALAKARPELVACRLGEAELTYGELDRRAGVLARRLRELGVGRDSVVALLLERGFDVIVGMLAAQKAGGAFVVMDPGHPVRRLEFIIGDIAAPAVVTHSTLTDRLPPSTGWVAVHVDTDWDELERAEAAAAGPLAELADENSLAYVLYTSGSTGKPKGVMIEHHALNTFLLWLGNVFNFGPGDRLLQHMALIFDFAEGEIFTALTRGVTMVFVPDEHRTNPDVIGELIAAERITYVGGPPAILGRIPPAPYPDLKYMIAGGEAVTGDLVNRWNTPGRVFVNGYGPTEAAVGCIFYACEHRTWTGQPPIGRAMPNRVAYVLDRWDNPLPVGVPGEVVVGGEGLARGYLNRPELTAEKFIANPFRPGERMYRTGDLGMWSEDGQIQFLGRIDTQVKLNGLRIELEEIESTLVSHAAIAEAAVALREDGPGGKRLVGYLVPAGTDVPSADELRAFLLEDLPPYMVPHAFVTLEALPLTSVGKVDRVALPAPGVTTAETFLAPRTAAEEKVAEIFTLVLGVGRAGAEDSFFDLGGNSLQAARVLSRLGELGVDVRMRDFYTGPRVSDLARLVESTVDAVAAVPAEAEREAADDEDALRQEIEQLERRLREARAALAGGRSGREAAGTTPPVEGPAVLSASQEQLWFLDQLAPGQATYNIPVALRLTGPLDPDGLRQALDAAVARHASLRTTYRATNSVPYQVVADPVHVALPVDDVSTVPAAQREDAVTRILVEEARTPFDLAHDLMVRARLVRLAPTEHALSVVLHHISADGWSAGVFMRDLGELYDALRHGRSPDLPALPLSYVEYSVDQRRRLAGGDARDQLDYWGQRLAGAATLDLPADRPRPAVASNRGALCVYRMPAEVLEAIKALAAGQRVSNYAVLLSGLTAVMSRYTGETDVVVGTAGAGRNRPELEDMVGFFVNMLVLRTDHSGDPTFAELIGRTMETLLGAWDHQDAPFEQVVARLGRNRDASRNPLFQVSLDLLDSSLVDFSIPGLVADFVDVDPGVSRFDLAVNAYQEPDGITTRIEYSTDLFDEGRVRRLFEQVAHVLVAAAANPGLRLGQLPLTGRAEQAVSLGFGRGEVRPVTAGPVTAQLAAVFTGRADEVAVRAGTRSVTYAELDRASAAVAGFLRSRGIGAGHIVPVLMERGLDEVVAMLGVLRSGAAYSPLDAAAPAARLRFLAADTGAPLILTSGTHPAELPGTELVDIATIAPADGEPTTVDGEVAGDSLAYVLYTSGSTGEPKGVLIEHAMVTNYLDWMVRDFEVTGSARFLHCCSPMFDLAIGELLSTLVAGATVVIASRDEVHDPGALGELIRRERVSHVFTTPTIMRLVEPGEYPDLTHVMLAGEVLPPDLADAWNVAPRRVLNLYGPAETTVGATWYVCPPGPSGTAPPIGRPMPNRRVYVLNGADPAPVGVPGEIVIGGTGVARGYLNRPEQTADRFVADPFAPGQIAYRTGDLGWWTESGDLVFAGRRDGQVKLRGLRIELGEIEHALLGHPEVTQAAVVVRPDARGEDQLVAFVGGAVSTDALRAHLLGLLPTYMVPGTWVVLDELPLTPTGKIDRKALPTGPAPARADEAFVAARTATELRVVEVFADLLGVERVGVRDDFFALGGNSLQAIRIVAALNDGTDGGLTIRDFYSTSTVDDLAALLDARGEQARAEESRLLDEIENLSDEEVQRLLAGE